MTKIRNTRVRTFAVAISVAGGFALAACERQPEEPAKMATHAIEVPVATTPAAPSAPAAAPAVAEQTAPAEAKAAASAPPAKFGPATVQTETAVKPAPGSQPQPQAEDHSGHDMSAPSSGDSHSGH